LPAVTTAPADDPNDDIQIVINTFARLRANYRRPCAEDVAAMRQSVTEALARQWTEEQMTNLSRMWPPRGSS